MTKPFLHLRYVGFVIEGFIGVFIESNFVFGVMLNILCPALFAS